MKSSHVYTKACEYTKIVGKEVVHNLSGAAPMSEYFTWIYDE